MPQDFYSASKITVLEGLDAVRYRPTMYFGPLDAPDLMVRVVREALCFSLDEAIAGCCSRIDVEVCKNGVITVDDDGRGVPLDLSPHEGRSGLEKLLSALHFGCRAARQARELAEELCQLGIAATNGVSEFLEAVNHREGQASTLRFTRGWLSQPLTELGPTDRSGLTLRFRPDPEILGDRRVDPRELDRVLDRWRSVVPCTTITLTSA